MNMIDANFSLYHNAHPRDVKNPQNIEIMIMQMEPNQQSKRLIIYIHLILGLKVMQSSVSGAVSVQ